MLRGVDGEDANPGESSISMSLLICFSIVWCTVCEHPAYRSIMIRTLPNLTILDGECIGKFALIGHGST
jgi:hypothetical protein